MYTEQDFWRDYPPNKNPFVFPWLQEKHEREIEKIQATAREALRAKEAAERIARQAALQAAEQAAKQAAEQAAKQAAEKAKMESRMETANALLAMGIDLSIISKATNLSEQQILALKAADVNINISSDVA